MKAAPAHEEVYLAPREVIARISYLTGIKGHKRYRVMREHGMLRKYYFRGNMTVPYYALSEVNQALTPIPEDDQ